MTSGRMAGIAAISATSVLWGTTGTAATFAPHAGPLAIGAAALGIGGLLQAVIALPNLRRARAGLAAHRSVVVLGAGAVAVYPLAFYSSMHLAGVAIGSVVSLASPPLVSGLLEWIATRRTPSRWWLLAAALGIAGSSLLCLSGDQSAESASHTGIGVVLGLAAGVSYATYSWAAQVLMGRGIDRGAAMGAVFGAGGLLLMPVLAVTGAPLIATPDAFLVAAYMALIPMFAGYVLFGYGLSHVPASTATTITLIEPAVATLLAVAVVGEKLAPTGWAGLCIIAGALVVLAVAPGDAADTVSGSRTVSDEQASPHRGSATAFHSS